MKCKYYKPYFDTLRMIISEYYLLENCCCGGPLHILLDDNNYDIGSVEFCIEHCFDALRDFDRLTPGKLTDQFGYPRDAYILGIMICNEYARMSLEERAAFDAYNCGHTLECDGNCENCPSQIFDDLYKHTKEAEEYAKTHN